MLERSDEIDQAVAGLRARRSPPEGAEARVLAGLELTLGGPPSGGGGSTGGAEGIGAAWVAKVIGATVAMTGGGLALVRAGAVVVGMAGGGERMPAPVEDREPAVFVPADEPVEHEPVAIEPVVAKPTTEAIEREPTSDSLTAEPVAPIHSAEDLEAELAMIRDARAQTDPAQALTRLDEHARTFPNGSLTHEREALRVITLCKLDRVAQARTAARALVESRPRSPLLDRMREGCPALADEFDE